MRSAEEHRKLADAIAEPGPDILWEGSEDQEFSLRMKACRARRRKYGQRNCDDKDGSCSECEHDMALALETAASKEARRDHRRRVSGAIGKAPAALREIAAAQDRTAAELREAVAAEREACAAIAKTAWLDHDYADLADADVMCRLCEDIAEDRIRSRSTSDKGGADV